MILAGVFLLLLSFTTIRPGNPSVPYFKEANDSLLNDKKKKEYLEMRGIVKQSKVSEKGNDELLDSAVIRIYSDQGPRVLLLELYTNKKGKCDFRLPLNQRFIIEFSKEGYVTKYIEVNSKIPKDKEAAYIFPFYVDIFEDIKGLDVSVLKKPIAKITYATNKSQFDYDYAYTNKINNDLKKLYKNYYFLQQIEIDSGQSPDTTGTGKK